MLPYREALDRILSIELPLGEESVLLLDASGRTLAEPIVARWSLPRFDNSAMDGYALRAEDAPEAGRTLRIIGESAAGRPFEGTVSKGEAVHINTGAEMPAGCDAVLPIEVARQDGDQVTFDKEATPGRHIRRKGEDVEEGEQLAAPGCRIDPVKLAAIGMFDIREVVVRKKPRVAIFTSGDEIKMLGEVLGPTDLVGVNVYYLERELTAMGCETRLLGVARDDRADFERMAREALEWGDFVVTTAGVSVGAHDVVGPVLDDLGAEVLFWKVAVRPGKPMLVARVAGKPWFGLPGNPVSSWANTEVFLKPFLRAKLGADMVEKPTVKMRLSADCSRDRARLFFVAAKSRVQDGELHVAPLAHQSSGNLWNAARANALVVLEPGEEPVPAGEMVDVLTVETGA